MDSLVLQFGALPGPVIISIFVGHAVLFAIGCNLTHKSRGFYVLVALSAMVAYLLLRLLVITGEYNAEYLRHLAETMPMLGVAFLVLGGYIFGEANIKRHRVEGNGPQPSDDII